MLFERNTCMVSKLRGRCRYGPFPRTIPPMASPPTQPTGPPSEQPIDFAVPDELSAPIKQIAWSDQPLRCCPFAGGAVLDPAVVSPRNAPPSGVVGPPKPSSR